MLLQIFTLHQALIFLVTDTSRLYSLLIQSCILTCKLRIKFQGSEPKYSDVTGGS